MKATPAAPPAETRRDSRYDALRARDRRFDGTFFVGVRTTGIYCRPVCRVRLPLERNCTFYDSAAAAERDGYRPCLRCRPELAPGRSLTDAHARLANAAYARIIAGALDAGSLADMARELYVSERQLRRAVSVEFGASPIELAQTQRLLLAKQLLTETDLPMTRVAYGAGFASLTRFNALFRERYRMSPTQLRRERSSGGSEGVTLQFGYRPPFAWDRLLRFLGTRAVAGVEHADATSYARTARFGDHAGWFRVRNDAERSVLVVEIADSLVPALLPLRAALRRAFDLDAAPDAIAAHFAADARLAPLVRDCPGLRLPGCVDPFEIAVRGVVGQQISVAGARTILGRITTALGDPLADARAGLERLFVTPARLAQTSPDVIAKLGMPLARARTLVRLGEAVASGELSLRAPRDIEELKAALCSLPGIGPWTAEYIAMRGLHWPDAFLPTDVGVRNALGRIDAAAAATLAEPWRPWRSYAVIHLWDSLARTGSE